MTQTVDERERAQRTLHMMFRAGARVAMATGVNLRRLKGAVEDAYVQEALESGWPLKKIGEVLDVSASKTALLSRQLKQGVVSKDHTDELELDRRLEYMLWARPMTLARMNQVLPRERYSDLAKAVRRLVADERVSASDDEGQVTTYSLRVDPERRPWERYLSRLEGAQRGMRAAADAVTSLFVEESGEPAQAYSVEVQLAPEQIPQARELIEAKMNELTEALRAMDETGAMRVDSKPLRLGAFWAADTSGEDD